MSNNFIRNENSIFCPFIAIFETEKKTIELFLSQKKVFPAAQNKYSS